MNVVLYSTGCPRCSVLERKLSNAKIEYSVIDDEDLMVEKGFKSVPMLEVDGALMTFKEAVDWISTKQE